MCVCTLLYIHIHLHLVWYGTIFCPESWNHFSICITRLSSGLSKRTCRVQQGGCFPIPQFRNRGWGKTQVGQPDSLNHKRTISFFWMAGQWSWVFLEITMSLQYWTIEWSLMHISSRIALITLISCQTHLSPPEFCPWNLEHPFLHD